MYTTGTAFLEALKEAGVSYIFANLGSDHPAVVESVAEGKSSGRGFPAMLTCPNEMVALSAAHGYAQVSGQAQAVIVHVEAFEPFEGEFDLDKTNPLLDQSPSEQKPASKPGSVEIRGILHLVPGDFRFVGAEQVRVLADGEQ